MPYLLFRCGTGHGPGTLWLLCNEDKLLKAKALEAGVKKEWLKAPDNAPNTPKSTPRSGLFRSALNRTPRTNAKLAGSTSTRLGMPCTPLQQNTEPTGNAMMANGPRAVAAH